MDNYVAFITTKEIKTDEKIVENWFHFTEEEITNSKLSIMHRTYLNTIG